MRCIWIVKMLQELNVLVCVKCTFLPRVIKLQIWSDPIPQPYKVHRCCEHTLEPLLCFQQDSIRPLWADFQFPVLTLFCKQLTCDHRETSGLLKVCLRMFNSTQCAGEKHDLCACVHVCVFWPAVSVYPKGL